MDISTYLKAKNLPVRSIPRAANTTKPSRQARFLFLGRHLVSGGKARGTGFRRFPSRESGA
jgi:hypothetical protein